MGLFGVVGRAHSFFSFFPACLPSFFLTQKEPEMSAVLSQWKTETDENNIEPGDLERLAFIFPNCFKLLACESFIGCGQVT